MQMRRSVVASGGTTAGDAWHALKGTVGQAATGRSYATSHILESGYWSRGTSTAVSVAPINLFNDCFPVNSTNQIPVPVPGNGFDTTTAYVRTGLNLSPPTGQIGSNGRHDVPADTVVFQSPGSDVRTDLVFRILPGVGNYVSIGNRASGLVRVVTASGGARGAAANIVTSGDTTFWGRYMADNGAVGILGNGTTGPGHAGFGGALSGWDANVWNSARMDTAERNLFPRDGFSANVGQLTPGLYASQYHESDPKFFQLGVRKNRCVLQPKTTGTPDLAIDERFIRCGQTTPPGFQGTDPNWPGAEYSTAASGMAASEIPDPSLVGRTGPVGGRGETYEYTQILPDGLLTPGSHVEYFLRTSAVSSPLTPVSMVPDTNRIVPQAGEGGNLDGHRWQQFGVLPDRWKDPAFGGLGMATMLVVDLADGSGEERAWIAIADSIGETTPSRWGAHNGWKAQGGQNIYDVDVGANDAICVRPHLGQAGTLFDLYQVRGGGSMDAAGHLGSRFANEQNPGVEVGKFSRHGPSQAMLLDNYRHILLLGGSLGCVALGPLVDLTDDDIFLLTSFLNVSGDLSNLPRSMHALGTNLVEGQENCGDPSFFANQFLATLRFADYRTFNTNNVADLLAFPPVSPTSQIYAVSNAPGASNDVFNVEAAPAQASARYENVGAAGPYVAGVYADDSGPRNSRTLVEGWRIGATMGTRSTLSRPGMHKYWYDLMTNVFGETAGAPLGIVGVPVVLAAYPASGGNVGVATVTVSGLNLASGATVKLTRGGQPDVGGTEVTVAPGGLSLSATFDLAGKALGTWDVVVTNPDSQVAALSNGFTIGALTAPQLRVTIVGPDTIRASHRAAFDLVLENQGNVDALTVPLWITGIPTSADTVRLAFTPSAPFRALGEPDWTMVQDTLTSPGGRYLALVIPRLPPGTLSRRLSLSVPSNLTFTLGAALTPPWTADTTFRSCLSGAGVIPNSACIGTQLSAINDSLLATPGVQPLNGVAEWAKIAWQCQGATSSMAAAVDTARRVLNYLVQRVETGTAPAGCGAALLPRWRDSLVVFVGSSKDPNDKLGPTGTVSAQQNIPYSIRFENTGSLAAYRVIITDALATMLDLSTVRLDAIVFGSTTDPASGSPPHYSEFQFPSRNLKLTVYATLDLPSRELSWSFRSFDLATGQELGPGSTNGFLLPGEEGSVLFTVRPSSGAADSSQIQNQATIAFDTPGVDGSTQTTLPVVNTLDNQAPASNVQPLSATIGTPSFPVSWVSNAPPDFRDFTIYVAEDAGPYNVWTGMENTTQTSGSYTPRPGGHTYKFYSEAHDTHGNVETAPTPPPDPGAQTYSIYGTTGVEAPAVWALALEGARPNPARGMISVGFTLPSSERATLELIDIAGRRVARREVGSLGPGRHVVQLGGSPRLRSGLYFLRLIQGERVLKARVVLMR
jgi:hypothetical protein